MVARLDRSGSIGIVVNGRAYGILEQLSDALSRRTSDHGTRGDQRLTPTQRTLFLQSREIGLTMYPSPLW